MEVITDFIETCQRMFSPNGRLSTAIPGFIPRDSQTKLAVAIATAVEQNSLLVAEAGTGTGKTYAYLLPALISGKKTLVSTATKTLQDQLYNKDLPGLVKALGLAVKVQILKGRANYICLYRTHLHADEGSFQSQQTAAQVTSIRARLGQLSLGERGEFPEIKEDAQVWPWVTSTTENCLGGDCQYYQDCYLVKARKRAMDADVVVINHHLFFADSRLKEQGFSELLPGAEIVIFDEAHQLVDVAVNFFGERISTRQWQDLLTDMTKEWPILDLANQPLKELALQLEKIIERLMNALPGHEDKYVWARVYQQREIKSIWDEFIDWKQALKACFDNEEILEAAGMKRCQERLLELDAVFSHFETPQADTIQWLECFKQTIVWHSTPFEVAQSFTSLIQRQKAAYIFTSATLAIGDRFDSFVKPLGILEAATLRLASPFDYQTQALLYLPRGMPDPKQGSYYDRLLARAIPVINACGGRCFFLFTSHRALKQVASVLANQLKYPLLVQGEESKHILLARFRELGNAVLLGTATFWEGVDVKGEALSCVIIDKLPFASPVDPVVQGKMAYYQAKGLSGFDELTLPEAVIALKQGVGRLIRDVSDRGVLMLADPRLTSRLYAQIIFASLPPIPKTRDEQVVLQFIRNLELNHEPVGH